MTNTSDRFVRECGAAAQLRNNGYDKSSVYESVLKFGPGYFAGYWSLL